MRFNYQLMASDLGAAARYLVKHDATIRGQFFRSQVVSAISFAIAGIIVAFIFGNQLLIPLIITAVICATIWFFAYSSIIQKRYIQRYTKVASNNERAYVREVQLRIEPDGLVTSTEKGIGKLYWSSILRIDSDTQYVYVIMGAANVLIIPMRAFGTTEAAQAFLEEVSMKREASTESGTKPIKKDA